VVIGSDQRPAVFQPPLAAIWQTTTAERRPNEPKLLVN